MSRRPGRNRGITGPTGPPGNADEKARAEYAAAMREYRKFLEQCETEATSELDKTTIALSGGAIGIAIAFLKEIPATTPEWAIVRLFGGGLAALVVSVVGVLLSLMASRKSMRYELQCVDGIRKKPDAEQAGGKWRSATETFNWMALVGCVVGLGALSWFLVVVLLWRQ